MIEEICNHCYQVKQCEEVGKYYLCSEHKELKQYQPKVKKKARIKPRSDKRAGQEKEYKVVRKEFLEENPLCKVCLDIDNPIKREATDVHHPFGRIGTLLTDKKHFLAVCRDHHTKIENNPVWAKEMGYSGSRLAVSNLYK